MYTPHSNLIFDQHQGHLESSRRIWRPNNVPPPSRATKAKHSQHGITIQCFRLSSRPVQPAAAWCTFTELSGLRQRVELQHIPKPPGAPRQHRSGRFLSLRAPSPKPLNFAPTVATAAAATAAFGPWQRARIAPRRSLRWPWGVSGQGGVRWVGG